MSDSRVAAMLESVFTTAGSALPSGVADWLRGAVATGQVAMVNVQPEQAATVLVPSGFPEGLQAVSAPAPSSFVEGLEGVMRSGITEEAYIGLIVLPILLFYCRAKIMMWFHAIVFLLLSNEKKGLSMARDAADVVPKFSGLKMESKTIIFIRHGESDWNMIFNTSKVMLLPRLLFGLLRELFLLPSMNSVFVDSDLSSEGVAQARRLQRRIQEYDGEGDDEFVSQAMCALRGDRDALSSVLVSSNLRRAVSTGCISLWQRISNKRERIILLPSLQEMSPNVDTASIAKPFSLPETSTLTSILGYSFVPSSYLDVKESSGNKALSSRAHARMEAFAEWALKRPEPVIIVSAGHSLWYKNFFNVFIPKHKAHPGKTHKIVNCGAVAFRLEKGVYRKHANQVGYRVDPESIAVLSGGFEKLQPGAYKTNSGNTRRVSDFSRLSVDKSKLQEGNENIPWWECCSSRD
eukprot:TRINITY_DN34571_c0_g1_i1.p1 TRINITY_DN34571_c0_g1~~TRINITY_DN34571_c0_g1_i1.p1  ORF type:complete len:484 (+),score=84.27 TRINITY_DN34571_c0_g1_i1:63-1454(+)